MNARIGALLLLCLVSCRSFAPPRPPRHAPPRAVLDGRGEDHLSASLEDGDVVVYRTGSWTVDGVAVGDGDPALAFAVVTLVQLVFTHNCEHGWIHGARLDVDEAGTLRPSDDDAWVQFGPEQLVAKLEGDEAADGSVALGGPSREAVAAARAAL